MAKSQRDKGKRGELYFCKALKDIFPNVQRTGFEQARFGGVDLAHTSIFNMEVKVGKQSSIKKIRGWLDQVKDEGKKENFDVVLAKPDREEAFVVMPFPDFLELLSYLKNADLL